MTKTVWYAGAGGFIGGHLVKELERQGFWSSVLDLKYNEHAETEADDFAIGDLRDQAFCRSVVIDRSPRSSN